MTVASNVTVIWSVYEDIVLKQEGTPGIIFRLLRTTLLVDLILAIVVALTCFFLHLRTFAAYGTLLVWLGTAVIVLACITGIGGFAARVEDASAFSRSGAGDRFENLQHIGDARSSNLGCIAQLLSEGIGLIAFGYLVQIISVLF